MIGHFVKVTQSGERLALTCTSKWDACPGQYPIFTRNSHNILMFLLRSMCSRNVDWPHTHKLILQSIEALICWPVSFFNLQDVKGVWLDQSCTSRSRTYDLKCQVAIIRVARAWTPIKGCHSTMPTMCPWGRTKKSATHQDMYHLPPIIRQHAGHQLRLPCMMQSACLTWKVPLSAGYIKHTPYGPEDMTNRQPSGCQSTMINMNDQPVPTYRTSEVEQYG